MLGVTSGTVALWARVGALKPFMRTPGGQRRYRRYDVHVFSEYQKTFELTPEQKKMEEDAVRLYGQGWSIRRVAEQFDCSYGKMRRMLLKHTPLRNR